MATAMPRQMQQLLPTPDPTPATTASPSESMSTAATSPSQSVPPLQEPPVEQSPVLGEDNFDTSQLRSLLPLASISLSTAKPSCALGALLSPLTSLFWQSDGPQPHLLTIHFTRLVSILAIRIYLDFALDESYTPTRIGWWAGMGMHDLVEIGEMAGPAMQAPQGWIAVDLTGVGGEDESGDEGDEEDGVGKAVLKARVVQMRVLENHQNGKDTHVRGLQVWGKREDGGGRRGRGMNVPEERMQLGGLEEMDWNHDEGTDQMVRRSRRIREFETMDGEAMLGDLAANIEGNDEGRDSRSGRGGILGELPDWMKDPVLR